MYDYDSTAGERCQLDALIKKLKPKKEWAAKATPWLSKHVSATQLGYYIHCGDYLSMLADETLEKRKIETAFFCKLRLCPGCAWRASLRSATAVSAISQELQAQGRVMLMVTLTVPNVPGDMLRDACIRLGTAWKRLAQRKAYAVWADNIRKLEITYNAKRDDYHPHMHVIVFVRPGYFKGGGGYISQAKLLEDWRRATGLDAITQVDIRRCRDRESGSNAVLEVSKYTAKAGDYTSSERVYDVMYATLYHLRTMTYAGVCKALKADYDAGKLDKWLPTDTTRYVWRLVYQYHEGLGYVHEDTEAYTPPVPAGFGELVGDATPWDGSTAIALAEVT